jgi:hypothetical protein
MPPTPRWTRPAGADTWFLTVAVRFSADHRHQLFPSELFANIVRQGGGHPSVPAEVVATVLVLQAPEGPSDREAISALRRDIVWKVACGLRLDDEGFHPTVLVYWRNRIRTSPPATADLAGGPPGGGANRGAFGQHRRVLDCTVLEDAVATQDTVCQLIAAIRRSAGGWLRPARRDHDHPRGWRHSRVR